MPAAPRPNSKPRKYLASLDNNQPQVIIGASPETSKTFGDAKMPAAVESMSYFGEIPWHGLGQRVPVSDIYSVRQGIIHSGLGWEVEDQALVTVNGLKVPNRAIVRKTDNRVLGVVGPSYTPLQNFEMFDFFQEWLDAHVCHLHTAGSLQGGEKVWVLAAINSPGIEVVAGDSFQKFILLSNSHDGKNAVRVGFTPIRVVCANTMAMAHSNAASKLIRVRHSTKVKENVNAIREIMDAANADFNATAEQFKFLASRQINTADLTKFVKIVQGWADIADDELSTKAKNIIDKIIKTVETGVGQDVPAARGTWWWAYNGINNYLNYSDGRTADNRLEKLWFGQNAAKNQFALDTALALSA